MAENTKSTSGDIDELAVSLWEAVAADDEQAVTSLLEKGANPDHEMYFTEKWLTSIENNEPHPLLIACKNRNLVMIKLLIEKGGVDVNRKLSPRTGETVLLASCGRYGNLDIVKYLLENAKCDRGLTDNKGNSPINVAESSSHVELVEYLKSFSHCQQVSAPKSDQREEMSEPYLDELATEEGSPIDSLQSTINSLSKKAQSFNKESEEADAAVDEIAGTLTQWNMDFVKLKSNEHAVLTDRIASSTGIVGSFLSLADIILPMLGEKKIWTMCFGELTRCFALWSSTTSLMRRKLVEAGIVMGMMYWLEVCKHNPPSETLTFLTQLALTTLYNCVQVSSNVAHYMKKDCHQIVQCFTSSTDFDIRINSIFILSFMEGKLLKNQRHHLRISNLDAQTVLEEVTQSLLAESTFSSPISFLKGLQNVIAAESENVEAFTLPGLLSTVSESIASTNSDVQREAIILLWKLSSIPPCTEEIKMHKDLIKAIQNLQGSDNPTVALASTCVLGDLLGRKVSDIMACITYAEGCYLFCMYEKCIAICAEIMKSSIVIEDVHINKIKLLEGKATFCVFNKGFDELLSERSRNSDSVRQKLSTYVKQATKAVRLLGSVHDEGYIDSEGSRFLDLSMMYLISTENALGKCDRCLLCLRNLKKVKVNEEAQLKDVNGGPAQKTNLQSKGLQRSHVWPKAIFDAFSKGLPISTSRKLFRLCSTSLTQLTELKSPKEITWYILCRECEQLLGGIEEQFIRLFFKKIYDVNSSSKPFEAQKIAYGEWLYQFCVSIFLRGVAVLSCNEIFKCINADRLYKLFVSSRKLLIQKTSIANESDSALPHVYLLINPISPTSEESQLFTSIHEALVSPASLGISDKCSSSNVYFRPRYEAGLFVAHIGILNVVIDIGSVKLTAGCHSIEFGDGEYHVPSENERGQLLPLEVKKVFYAVAHEIEVQTSLMPDKLRDSHWAKSSREPPKKQNEETFLISQAQDHDQKLLYKQGVKPSQDFGTVKDMNFLPKGFKVRRLKTNSGTVELPPGHRILLHGETRHSDSSYHKGTTVFLVLGDGSKKYPSDKPYAIYHQYDPGMYITLGMFLSSDDLSVISILADDEPKRYARKMCESPNFQENMQYTLMTLLYFTGFNSLKSFLPHAEDKIYTKCLTRRRCWYCEDLCENCMEQAANGLTEETEGVLLKFCSKKCKIALRNNPKVINMLPPTFQVSISDGKANVTPPPSHIAFQRVMDTLYDKELELNAIRTIYVCFGDGSTEFPRDRIYIIYKRYTVLRQTLAACFVSDDLSLSILSTPLKSCDTDVASSYIDYFQPEVESMLQAVLSDAGFTSFLSWRLYMLFKLGIAYVDMKS